MTDVHHAVLRCHRCGNDAPHEVRYAGRLFLGTRCERCRFQVDAADPHRYFVDLRHRVTTKPVRMLRRLCDNPARFMLTLPGAAASKPFKLLHELASVFLAAHPEQRR